MTWDDALRLGRVSNLPTVWTNMLTGLVLAGGSLVDPRILPLLIALSLFYVGGMYLNDAFDAELDAKERPERPIPSGQISARTVFIAGSETDLSGLSIAQAYQSGDLDGDGVNSIGDFGEFKTAFDAVNGLGAFEAMLAGVPEPGTIVMMNTIADLPVK